MTPELKAAWRKLRSYQEKDLIDPNEAILMDAYLDAEARARRAEHILNQHNGDESDCEFVNWTDADWRAEVLKELEEK